MTQPVPMPPPGPGTVRIAVLSDAHLGGRGEAVWHNRLRYDEAPAILASAVRAATAQRAVLLLALGDLADLGDQASLRDVRAALSVFPGPVRVVPGNHDRARDNESFEAEVADPAADLSLAGSTLERHAGFGLCGLTVWSDDGGRTCVGVLPDPSSWPAGLVVLASHYPVLDVTERLAGAGVRDAGTLRNHDAVPPDLTDRPAPTLVLNGHLHARVEHAVGSALQLSVGALVEVPHEVTFVDLTPSSDGESTDVVVRRLSLPPSGESEASTSPVLAPSVSRWEWSDAGWTRLPPAAGGRPVLCLDWNGTVVDDDERAREVSVSVLAELGVDVDRLRTVQDFRRDFTLPLSSFFSRQGVRDHALARAVARWNEGMLAAAPPRLGPGARDLLTWAMRNDVSIHIVSGADPRVVTADLAALLPEVRVTSVVGHAHPKSAVLERLSASGPVVFVGDTAYDVVEGRRAGGFAVGFAADAAKADRLAAAGADAVVTDLAQVAELISARHLAHFA
ncbi:metallophosphoesterase [Nocardioides humi]|uniref:Calcineurin-like phosphoesterase domain-containing protein n=1 Tax=Nocardioides humi TaxID=449461 RepID=A0ABN2BFR6_9ACTN|nr:metallophosphoesterase [Nocardioides humi]